MSKNNMFDRKENARTTLGAMCPPGLEWQEGKTAASIAFVKEAEKYLRTNPQDEDKLRPYVNMIKDGEIVLTEWLSLKEELKKL